jgi:hypothetical protein
LDPVMPPPRSIVLIIFLLPWFQKTLILT